MRLHAVERRDLWTLAGIDPTALRLPVGGHGVP